MGSNRKTDTVLDPTGYSQRPGTRRGCRPRAAADASGSCHGLWGTKLLWGLLLMAQTVKFLTGLFLGDRWRCRSIILGHPITTWCEGAKAQVPCLWGGQILVQVTPQGSPVLGCGRVSSDTTRWLCFFPSLALCSFPLGNKLPKKQTNGNPKPHLGLCF